MNMNKAKTLLGLRGCGKFGPEISGKPWANFRKKGGTGVSRENLSLKRDCVKKKHKGASEEKQPEGPSFELTAASQGEQKKGEG